MDNKEFNEGVMWACARIVEMHDEPTIAKDVFLEANIPVEDVEQMCSYDLDFIRKGIPELPKGTE